MRNNLLHNGITIPASNYMFKVNNRNTRRRCEICSKLTIKTLAFNTYKCEAEKRKTWSNHRRSHPKVFCKKGILKLFLQKKIPLRKNTYSNICVWLCVSLFLLIAFFHFLITEKFSQILTTVYQPTKCSMNKHTECVPPSEDS